MKFEKAEPQETLVIDRKRFYMRRTDRLIDGLTDRQVQSNIPLFFEVGHKIDTWKTLGADTKLARAEDRVAEKIPAVIRGPNAEVISMA